MPEETRVTMPPALQSVADQRRIRTLKRALPVGLIAAVLTAASYTFLYLQTQVWQILAVAVGTAASAVCLLPARRRFRQNDLDGTGHWLLASIVLAFGTGEAFWVNDTLFATVGALLLFLLLGSLVRPRRWGVWAATAVAYGGLIMAVNNIQPLPRYDIMQGQLLNAFIPVAVGALLLTVLWLIVQASFRYSLRTKVIAAFLIVVFSAIGAVVLLSGLTNRASLTANVGVNLKTLAREKASTVEALLGKQIAILEVLALSDSVQAGVIRANAAYSETSDLPAIRSAIAQRDVAWTIAPESDPLVQGVLTNVAARELQEFRARFPDDAEILVTDKYGATIAATNRTAKYAQAGQAWWQVVYSGNQGAIYISEPNFNRSLATFGIIMAVPIYSPNSQSIAGVLYALYRIEAITAELGAERFGQTGQTGLLLGGDQMLTAEGIITVSPEDLKQLTASMAADYAVFNYGGAPQLVSQDLVVPAATGLGWRLVVAQSPDEALEPVLAAERTTVVVGLVTLALTAALAVSMAQFLSRPILHLTAVAERIAAGDLKVQAVAESRDEIGTLAVTFNKMTAQLRGLIGSLEQRTKDLATVAEVGTATAPLLETDKLLQAVVDLAQERFNLYHAQIYLLDRAGENLVLASGAGELGRHMKAKGFAIPLNREQSPVARAARERQGVAVNDVTQAPDFSFNPLLPDIRSELAVPMIVGGNMIGVLAAQSDRVGRFTGSDINIHTTLAAQVAASLQNIRQYETTRKIAADLSVVANVSIVTSTITEAGRLLQEVVDLSKKSFNLYHAHIYLLNEAGDTLELAAGAGAIGRQMAAEKRSILLDSEKSLVARAARTREGVVVNDVTAAPDFLPNPLLPDTRSEMAVPMLVAGKVIGVLDVQSEQVNRFTEIDVSIKTTLAAQIAVALQNARSFLQTQRQAQRETSVNLITRKIQNAPSVEAALQIAARELGRALGKQASVRLHSADFQVDAQRMTTVE